MLGNSSGEPVWQTSASMGSFGQNCILAPLPVLQHCYSILCNFSCSNASCHVQNSPHMSTLPSVSCCEKSPCGELQESTHIALLKTVHKKDNCNFWSQRQSRARCYKQTTQHNKYDFSSIFKARKKAHVLYLSCSNAVNPLL